MENLKIDGNGTEELHGFCVWAIRENNQVIAKLYGSWSLGAALAAVECKNETFHNGTYTVTHLEDGPHAGTYEVRDNTRVVAYISGEKAQEIADRAASELSFNKDFADDFTRRASKYVI